MKFLKHIFLGICLLMPLNGHAWSFWNITKYIKKTETIKQVAAITGLVAGLAVGILTHTYFGYSTLASIGFGTATTLFAGNATRGTLAGFYVLATRFHRRSSGTPISPSHEFQQSPQAPAILVATQPKSVRKPQPSDWTHYYREAAIEQKDAAAWNNGAEVYSIGSEDDSDSDDDYQDPMNSHPEAKP